MVNTAMYLKDSKNINRKIQINHTTVGTYVYSFLGMIYSMAVNILMLRKQFSLSSLSESLARNTLSELPISVQIMADASPGSLTGDRMKIIALLSEYKAMSDILLQDAEDQLF